VQRTFGSCTFHRLGRRRSGEHTRHTDSTVDPEDGPSGGGNGTRRPQRDHRSHHGARRAPPRGSCMARRCAQVGQTLEAPHPQHLRAQIGSFRSLGMAGYSGAPLAMKLGIKEGWKVCTVEAPRNYLELVSPLPQGASVTARVSRDADLVHVFSKDKAILAERLTRLRATLKPDAAIWVSWPKRSSKVPTDITEDTIREIALPLGFVDIKVCAVTDVWSGLKLMVRKELR
jgi:hypothetical protein